MYVAQVRLQNDETGAVFEEGDQVTVDDFKPEVIEAWLAIGVLSAVDDGGDEEE